MKRTLIKVTVAVLLLAGSIFFMNEENDSLSDVALENIEALAAGEGTGGMWFCRGIGSLDCPNGTKVKYIVRDYRLDLHL